MRRFILCFAVSLALVASGRAGADVIVTLGEQDFTDGEMLSGPQYQAPQAGEPVPFDGARGFDSDLPEDPPFSESWSFSYALGGPIAGATLTLGIWDHDSGAEPPGSETVQVASFTVDGHDLTAELNAAFEAKGGTIGVFVNEYNVYSVSLPAATFPDLADNSATVSLTLQNGVAGFPPSQTVTASNGAGLDFSTLAIDVVPEPSTLVLLGVAAFVLLGFQRRKSPGRVAVAR
jgi:hypothetical protein